MHIRPGILAGREALEGGWTHLHEIKLESLMRSAEALNRRSLNRRSTFGLPLTVVRAPCVRSLAVFNFSSFTVSPFDISPVSHEDQSAEAGRGEPN